MKRHIPLLIAALALVSTLVLGSGAVAQASPHDAPSPLPKTLCQQTPGPRGWVIIDEQSDPAQCGGLNPLVSLFTQNLKVVSPTIGDWMEVCADSPVPESWVITSVSTDLTHCGHHLLNTIAIEQATGAAFSICPQSPIPAGWVTTAEYRLLDHPEAQVHCDGNPLGVALRTIERTTGNAMRVCQDSPVPVGYRIARQFTDVNCHADTGNSRFIVPTTVSSTPQ